MKVSSEYSHKIENMSLFCAICVVAIHIGWDDGSVLGRFITASIKDGFATIAVPFFFTVSGFFLSAHFNEERWYGREVRKRIKSLVIPYFLWISIAIALMWPLTIYANLQAHRQLSANLPPLIEAYGLNIFCVPGMVGSLWYVRCLIVIVLLSPIIKFTIHKFGCLWLGFLFIALIVHSALIRINGGSGDNMMLRLFNGGPLSIRGLFYFSVGCYISIKKIHNVNKYMAISCGLIGIVLLSIHCYEDLNGFRSGVPYVALAIPFFIYSVFKFMPSKRLPDFLRGCSFPIYLMHGLVLGLFNLLISQLSFNIPIVVHSVILLVLGVVVPIIICNFLRCYVPQVSKVVFGGR